MRGLKMILTGFLFTLTGISLIIILTIPNTTSLISDLVTQTTYENLSTENLSADQKAYQVNLNITNCIHTVEEVASLLVIGGLVLACIGTFYKESIPKAYKQFTLDEPHQSLVDVGQSTCQNTTQDLPEKSD